MSQRDDVRREIGLVSPSWTRAALGLLVFAVAVKRFSRTD